MVTVCMRMQILPLAFAVVTDERRAVVADTRIKSNVMTKPLEKGE